MPRLRLGDLLILCGCLATLGSRNGAEKRSRHSNRLRLAQDNAYARMFHPRRNSGSSKLSFLQTDAKWSDAWARDPGSEVIGDVVSDQNLINVMPQPRKGDFAFSYRSPGEQMDDMNAPGDPKMAAAMNVNTNMSPVEEGPTELEPGDVTSGQNGPDDDK